MRDPGKNILIIDDEEGLRHVLSIILTKEGYKVEAVKNGKEGIDCLEKYTYDLVLCDIRMPVMDGLEFLKTIASRNMSVTVIMMSAFGTIDQAIEAMKLGAYDYISKPFKPDEILLAIKKAEERERLRRENQELRKVVKKDYGVEGIISQNKNMLDILATVKKISDYKTTVLITGESGTGKELISKALHFNGNRSGGLFVAINCGAIPETLLESELFGHVKGAFTDAIRTKKGLFEEADKGTLFLDEIGELPMHLQVKLLRTLQEEEIMKVGDSKPLKIDVRIIAATVRDLGKEVKEGRFREDLYYRLNILPIHLPPLRERKEDIPRLIEYFLEKYRLKHGLDVRRIPRDTMQVMMDYGWPGNIRELENTIERISLLSENEEIPPSFLPTEIRSCVSSRPSDAWKLGDTLSIKRSSLEMEKDLITKALIKTSGNRTRAAELLEISHRALLYKIKEYGL